jgi:hypothetical protein
MCCHPGLTIQKKWRVHSYNKDSGKKKRFGKSNNCPKVVHGGILQFLLVVNDDQKSMCIVGLMDIRFAWKEATAFVQANLSTNFVVWVQVSSIVTMTKITSFYT